MSEIMSSELKTAKNPWIIILLVMALILGGLNYYFYDFGKRIESQNFEKNLVYAIAANKTKKVGKFTLQPSVQGQMILTFEDAMPSSLDVATKKKGE